MPTKIKAWEIHGDRLEEAKEAEFSKYHKEEDLEDWIARDPRPLGEELLVIARQRDIPSVGRLDLLGIDSSGGLVIVELKRGMAPREAVAQALDYASWLDNESPERIAEFAREYLKKDLEEAFVERFDQEFSGLDLQDHRIILVAPELDNSAERIITYLAQRHSIEINAVFFAYRKLSSGTEVLVRSVLVPESVISPPLHKRPSEAKLLEMARERETYELLQACREVRNIIRRLEEPASTAGGSFRYWADKPGGGGRMILGINVSGNLGAPRGQLDVWVRPDKLAEVWGGSKAAVEEAFRRQFETRSAPAGYDLVIGIKTKQDVEKLVAALEELLSQRDEKEARNPVSRPPVPNP